MRVLFVSFAVVLIDQISKFYVKGISISFLNLNFEGMYIGQRIPIIRDFFNITFVENPGIAFGIDLGNSFKMLISIFSIAASGLLLFYLYKSRKKILILRLSLALILGGAVGNLLDRAFYGIIYGYAPLFHGKVVDFFNLRFFDLFMFNRIFGSYVFNFADIAVTVGVVLFLFALNNQNMNEKEESAAVGNLLTENKD